jgi:hypothetical protein
MAGDIKTKYPASNADTTALTITIASLATSSTLLVGRESTAVNNTSNLDEDHLVSGQITVGTSPTGGRIELWAYAPIAIASGTPDYGLLTGADAAKTFDSRNQLLSALKLLWSTGVDTTSNREYAIPPSSITQAFGQVPPYWGLFLTHSSGVNLHATSGNHFLHYHRVQKQYT